MFRKDKGITLLNGTSLCLVIFSFSKLFKRKKNVKYLFGSVDTAYSPDNFELFKKITTV